MKKRRIILRDGDILSAAIPESLSERRDIARNQDDLTEKFFEEFDSNTVFYDSYFGIDGSFYVIGPPLRNLETHVKLQISGKEAPVESRKKLKKFDLIDAGHLPNVDSIEFKIGDTTKRVQGEISGPCRVFEGTTAIFTMFRYEPVHWIVEWVKYHVLVHGIDAVLLYLNNSDHTDVDEVANCLDEIEGLSAYGVVEWNFPYGPAGRICGKHPYKSAFLQVSTFEHARSRFLGKCRYVLNLDIDELLVTPDAVSVVDMMERKGCSGILLPEVRIGSDSNSSRSIEDRHYRMYQGISNEIPFGKNKWLIDPRVSKSPGSWMVHRIEDVKIQKCEGIWVAHFDPMSVDWKQGGRLLHLAGNTKPKDLLNCYKKAEWV